MSLTSVDLPEPDTPVTHVNVPERESRTGMPLRLCSRGLWMIEEARVALAAAPAGRGIA